MRSCQVLESGGRRWNKGRIVAHAPTIRTHFNENPNGAIFDAFCNSLLFRKCALARNWLKRKEIIWKRRNSRKHETFAKKEGYFLSKAGDLPPLQTEGLPCWYCWHLTWTLPKTLYWLAMLQKPLLLENVLVSCCYFFINLKIQRRRDVTWRSPLNVACRDGRHYTVIE